ncbi:hypothetical protein ACN08P_23060 (plasmid) [Photobacterium leiognathi subsp. mandapamensis]|uniref:hypothetical protein n=1 Tax=Photobacterium leiognathi TaxID=553611 RepID=UPI003AF3B200
MGFSPSHLSGVFKGTRYETQSENYSLVNDSSKNPIKFVPNGYTRVVTFDIEKQTPTAKDVRMVNRSVNYLIKVKPSKITKTTIAIKAAGRVSDEGLMQVEGIRKELDTFSHANLFINSDGWVNQRGVSAGHLTSNSSIYMRDRWFAHSGLGTPVEGEIVAYNTFWHEQMKMRVFQLNSWADVDSIYFFLAQNVEDLYFLAGLRDITISFKIFAINKPTGQFKIELRNVDDGSLKFDILMPAPSSSEWEYRKFTVPASELANVVNKDKPHLQVKFTDINETGRDAGFGIGEMKLEVGSKATPFVPDDPATNLAKCQRYYFKCFNYYSPRSYNVGGSFRHILTVNLPVSMRAAPAVSYKCALGSDSGDVDSNYQPAVSRYTEHAHFMATLTSGQYLRLDEVVFDAEL